MTTMVEGMAAAKREAAQAVQEAIKLQATGEAELSPDEVLSLLAKAGLTAEYFDAEVERLKRRLKAMADIEEVDAEQSDRDKWKAATSSARDSYDATKDRHRLELKVVEDAWKEAADRSSRETRNAKFKRDKALETLRLTANPEMLNQIKAKKVDLEKIKLTANRLQAKALAERNGDARTEFLSQLEQVRKDIAAKGEEITALEKSLLDPLAAF